MNRQINSTRKYNVYFVKPCSIQFKDQCSEDMLRAFDKCIEFGMQAVWISKKESNKMKFTKYDTLVVENYKNVSMNQLATAECCIIEPQHLPFFSKATPGRKSPMRTEVMQDLCICTSSLSFEDKRYVEVLVTKMSGTFTTELDNKVTHLVTSSVLSAEYEKAIQMKIQIVTKEWVKAIWEANKTDYVKSDDKIFDKYKVPMFYNLVVTATNIPKCQMEEIQHLMKDNGGEYMNTLDCEKVNIVLAPDNSCIDEKLRHARELDIICLSLNWLYESLKVGYALPFRNYIFQTKESKDFLKESNGPISAPSFITYDKQQSNYIDETAFKTSTMSNVSTSSTVTTVLDRPAFSEAESAGPFLFGCIIYLSGFTSDQLDKLNRILYVGAAMRFDYVCNILTHVIVGDEDSAARDIKLLKTGLRPYILRLEWLEESIKLKRPAPVENFLYKEENRTVQEVTGPSSSLIMNSQLLQERMSEEGQESFNFGQQELENAIVSTTDETVQEYLDLYVPDLSQMPESREEYSKLPETNDTNIITNRLFEGLTFVVSGYSDMYNYVVDTILVLNGRIVPGTSANIPDYAVVPKCGMPLECRAKEIVTFSFIDDCITQDRIVETMYYHRPICVTEPVLLGCILTISTYAGVERSYLITLAIELGAIYQDVLMQENIFEEDVYKNTHLICPTPKGKKYNTAIMWDIPVVTAEWLKACAAQSTRVDERPFLVVENFGPENPMEIDISSLQTNTNHIVFSTEPVASSSRSHNIIVPKEYFTNLEIQNNTFGNILLLNNEYNLPTKTTSEPSKALCSQEFGPIPSQETERSRLEGISYSSNLRKEEPPLESPFSKPVLVLENNCQEVNEKLPENHNVDEISAAANDDFN